MKLAFDSRVLPSPGSAELALREVEVWLAKHDLESGVQEGDTAVLRPDEVARASGMATIPRRQFVKTRAVLRRVLSSYSGIDAACFRFAYGPRGKPRLAPEHAASELHFSVSHSGDWAVIAVGRSPLGIDIEARRTVRDVDALASRFLAPGEARALRCVPALHREPVFLRFWARKEAYAKALGEGIAIGFRTFDLAVSPTSGTVLLGRDGAPDPEWILRDLSPGPGLVGALAVRQPDCTLWCWKLATSASRSGPS